MCYMIVHNIRDKISKQQRKHTWQIRQGTYDDTVQKEDVGIVEPNAQKDTKVHIGNVHVGQNAIT